MEISPAEPARACQITYYVCYTHIQILKVARDIKEHAYDPFFSEPSLAASLVILKMYTTRHKFPATPNVSAVRWVFIQEHAPLAPTLSSCFRKKVKVHHRTEKPTSHRMWLELLHPSTQNRRGHSKSGCTNAVSPMVRARGDTTATLSTMSK
mmetsp:Transcript_64747/g.174942  ORF Transcript_64747/g.174942 Transcript_64747/m.174942 type:complete len:152 (-) Transcript_64747:495-950(-)